MMTKMKPQGPRSPQGPQGLRILVKLLLLFFVELIGVILLGSFFLFGTSLGLVEGLIMKAAIIMIIVGRRHDNLNPLPDADEIPLHIPDDPGFPDDHPESNE